MCIIRRRTDGLDLTHSPIMDSKGRITTVENGKLEIENRQSDSPRLIAFEVTRRCRFNCKHCRANAGVSGDEKELTTEQCKRILASIADFSKPVIILTGGEPMERSDIYELIRYGRDLGLRMVMATCGYPINDESIAGLKEAGLLALSISLDGATARSHDAFRQTDAAFDSAVKAAEAAGRAGMRFQINTTITKSNVTEVPLIAELAEKLGAYCFDAFILVPTGRGKGIAEEMLEPVEYEKLLNELLNMKLESDIDMRVTCGPEFSRICKQKKVKKIKGSVSGCMGGRGFGFISCRGDVQTCGFLDVSAGNLIENGFEFDRIWLESEFLKEIRDLSAYKGNCGICKYVGLCGGCRARAYAMSGDYLDADPICNYKVKR
jgi:radical SAM protein with 4Fe4S-binding SPASM domain